MELSINSDINQPIRQALVDHVIPQLLDTSARVSAKLPFSQADAVELGRQCLDDDPLKAERYVRQLLADGHDIESLYLDAIPQAARLFHDWWYADDIDFISVTKGIFQLEQLIYSLSAEFVLGGSMKGSGPPLHALLVKPPESHHSLGLLILSQYFRRYGWQVFSANQFTADDMLSAVRSEWVDLIGISMSEDRQIPIMKKLIAKMRQRCSNPDVQIMVGGPLLRFCHNLAELVGADFACLQADQAQMQALELIKKTPVSSAVKPASA